MIEDEAFYDACDGVMLLQEMPHAGCAPGGPGDQVSGLLVKRDVRTLACSSRSSFSADLLTCPFQNPDYARLLPVDFAQQTTAIETLKSHASIVRYNYANEFYLNSSQSPFIAQFGGQARAQDDSRPVHKDPCCEFLK